MLYKVKNKFKKIKKIREIRKWNCNFIIRKEESPKQTKKERENNKIR